jgi:hypothetical protein
MINECNVTSIFKQVALTNINLGGSWKILLVLEFISVSCHVYFILSDSNFVISLFLVFSCQ